MTLAVPTVLWLAVVPLVLFILDVSASAAGSAWPRVRRLWAGPSGFSNATVATTHRRWLLWLGMILVIVAGARPQWGRIEEQTFDQSREVLIALDLSRSMLAEDVKPSRLARAKLLIESLLDRLEGERVGLILFSGTAFLQSPLSPDYEVLREFLPALGPDYLPEGGTDFDRLLSTSLDSFSNEGGADRFLIVLSDGESQTTEWRNRSERMTQRNIRVITLGIGTESGAVMPAEGGGFVKDARGAVILSRLEPQTLRDLARMTGGTYANAAAWVDIAALLEQTVERGKQGGFVQRSELRLQERFQWFLAAGLVLLAWSFWREFPVRPRVRDLKGRATSVAAALAILAIFTPPDAQAADGDLSDLAKKLSEQASLSAGDAASFANATIGYGEAQKQSGQPIPPTVLADGFASVDLGERSDRTAADWPELRRKLEELARPPDQQDKQDEEEKKEEEEQKDQQEQQGGGQNEEQQENKEDQQQDQEQEQQDQEQKENEKEQKRSGQKAFEDPPSEPQQQEDGEPQQQEPQQQPKKDTQTIGGAPTEDKELQERPELAVPLQKLDRVKQQDSPARLFQLMQDDEPKKPTKKERDW
ncbi:MAG TPA: VWA domain-containing protein [Opitutaceae bacterium]|nr:VWA domain-containing protein [Opitutaceae bacterium]